jgi:phosphatidylinositol glycan class M
MVKLVKSDNGSDFALTFACAIALRLVLILWSAHQDANFDVKYTDVDYIVYTDAARHVVNGGSPYARATYRYPPVLAILLTPNVLIHEVYGKVLFSALDVVVGGLILKIGLLRGYNGREIKYALWTWLFNPFTCTISTRGSCESLTGVLMLLVVHSLLVGDIAKGAIAYGAVVHFRLYPIIHSLMFVAYLSKRDIVGNRSLFQNFKFLSWVTVQNVKFGVLSALAFFGLSWVSFATYGMEYLDESILYHVRRTDHRHNFAPAFYGVYLDAHLQHEAVLSQSRVKQVSDLLASSALATLSVVLVLGFLLSRDMTFALFAQTLAFVTFNKVCTAQYFVWWFMLLPLILPSLMRSYRKKHLIFSFSLWIIAQLHWLVWAYSLEFKGMQVYRILWTASLAFFGANIWFLVNIIDAYELVDVIGPSKME